MTSRRNQHKPEGRKRETRPPDRQGGHLAMPPPSQKQQPAGQRGGKNARGEQNGDTCRHGPPLSSCRKDICGSRLGKQVKPSVQALGDLNRVAVRRAVAHIARASRLADETGQLLPGGNPCSPLVCTQVLRALTLPQSPMRILCLDGQQRTSIGPSAARQQGGRRPRLEPHGRAVQAGACVIRLRPATAGGSHRRPQ